MQSRLALSSLRDPGWSQPLKSWDYSLHHHTKLCLTSLFPNAKHSALHTLGIKSTFNIYTYTQKLGHTQAT